MRITVLINSLLICTLAIISIQSCQSGLSPQVETRKAEVMVIHDEVMPLMSTTRKLRKQINSHNHGGVDQLISDLEAADETMMQWMSDFGQLKQLTSEQEQMQYLDKMDARAKVMQKQFDNAIRNAENYVNNHKH